MINPKILLENHFKIHILLKDKIIFENELEKQNIDYFYFENEPILGNSIKYFIRDINKTLIDNILIKNQIIAETDTIKVSDYRDGKRIFKIYMKIAFFAFIIMILIILIEKYFKR